MSHVSGVMRKVIVLTMGKFTKGMTTSGNSRKMNFSIPIMKEEDFGSGRNSGVYIMRLSLVDWSTLMTKALNELRQAEEDLRLIHTHPKYFDFAKISVIKAEVTLLQLVDWINDYSEGELHRSQRGKAGRNEDTQAQMGKRQPRKKKAIQQTK